MDTAVLIGIVACIAGILKLLHSLLIGSLSLPEWLRRRRSRAPDRTAALTTVTPPPTVELSDEALEYRKFLNFLCKQYVERQEDATVNRLLQPIIAGGKVDEPAIRLPRDSDFVDLICGVVTREARTIAILPSGYSTPDIEGAGRSSLMLRLVGIIVPYGRLLGLDVSDIRSLQGNITVFSKENPWCRLLTTDMAYMGSSDGRLSIVPTKGEYVSFVWDMARNVFRSTELDYSTGDHRKDPGREKLLELSYRIPLASLAHLFGKIDETYSVDEIIILRRSKTSHSQENLPPSLREITEKDEKTKQLKDAMLASSKHGSSFWKRDAQALAKRVDYILTRIDLDKIKVSELNVPYPSLIPPSYVLDEVAEIVKKGKVGVTNKGMVNLEIGSGIRYHNDILFRSMYDTGEIRMLATSGEHIFRDAAFWKVLSQLRRTFKIEILLLDYESKDVHEREKLAYADKTKEFLQEEIKENIHTISRMSNDLSQGSSSINIICKLYQELPAFRMTFVGAQRSLVAAYQANQRTGPDTIFYDIHAVKEGDLFYGFEFEYNRISSRARQILPK
jgi:hypothetical protein